MALVDSGTRQRDSLPSITHLDLGQVKMDYSGHQRYAGMSGLSTSTGPMGSPTTIYSGPPPPYSSYSSSTAGSTRAPTGYLSPPEPSRRVPRDEKGSPNIPKSLPSIQEALGNNNMSYHTSTVAVPTPTALSHPSSSAPPSSVGQSFPDAPKGPPNPFSQPGAPASAMREHTSYSAQSHPSPSAPLESPHQRSLFTAINASEPRTTFAQIPAPEPSPKLHAGSSFRPAPQPYARSYNNSYDVTTVQSPTTYSVPRSSFSFQSPTTNPPPTSFPQPADSYRFDQPPKSEEPRPPFSRNSIPQSYGESVKRHLDVFDAELALNEIAEASSRSLDFARIWSQRSHQTHRSGYFPEVLPGLHEVDDMMRQTDRVMVCLGRIREVVIAQQNALSEQRARAARGDHVEEGFNGGLQDEFKNGGFAGGDAKKRRGKAGPPGRCHSCNRAETPEWRRGPDGARTLCNACGLHYAKLTRKMGVHKAAAIANANLRPKNLDPRSPPL